MRKWVRHWLRHWFDGEADGLFVLNLVLKAILIILVVGIVTGRFKDKPTPATSGITTARLLADKNGDTYLQVLSVSGPVPTVCADSEDDPDENLKCYLSDEGYYLDQGEWEMTATVDCWDRKRDKDSSKSCQDQIASGEFHLRPIFTRVK